LSNLNEKKVEKFAKGLARERRKQEGEWRETVVGLRFPKWGLGLGFLYLKKDGERG